MPLKPGPSPDGYMGWVGRTKEGQVGKGQGALPGFSYASPCRDLPKSPLSHREAWLGLQGRAVRPDCCCLRLNAQLPCPRLPA